MIFPPSLLRARRALGSVLSLAVALAVTGCSTTVPVEDLPGQGYVAGDGTWEVIAEPQRNAPLSFAGPTEDGGSLDAGELLGDVAVVNFWYAACPPCRVEAADLEALSQQYAPDSVQFVGVNIYDQAPTVHAFNAEFGVTYPSILDVETASVRLAFAGNVPPQAIPSALVLDRQGRVAAVIRGPIDRSVLASMIEEALAEVHS